MKTNFQVFLILLIANLGFSQTQIQLPTGYGLNGPNGFIQNVAMPFFSHNGNLYCKAHLYSNSSGFPGALFKVNETTNEVTEITGIPIAFDLLTTHSFQVYNGEIFCSLGNSGQVLRINPTLNTFLKITGIGFEYAILNDKIFGSNQVYHLTTGTFSNLMDPENPTQALQLSGPKLYNNSIFFTKVNYNNSNGNQYTAKIYRIFDSDLISLLYTNSFNGFYTGFDDGKPIFFNNKILNRFGKYTNNVLTTSVESYDLDTNILNTIFTYEPTNVQGSHYVFNNNIYFNNSLDQTLVSNGINEALVSDIPNIISNYGFSYNALSPTTNLSTIQTSNKIFGCKRVVNGNVVTYTVRKSNGTLNGTSTIYTSSNGQLYSAIIVDNDLYFFKLTASQGIGELIRYSDVTEEITNPVSFALSSQLFGVNNSIFFYGLMNGVYGLYKLETSTLSNENFAQNENLKIYPNPTSNILNIQLQIKAIIDKIVIYDLKGTKVIEQNNANQVNVEHLSKGLYVLEAFSGEEKWVSKFVKQ